MDSSGRVGRYVIFEEIAAGGMATVHLARQRGEAGFERTVAIKRLHPALARDPEAAEAFANEARHVSRVMHANVVPVLDVVREDGQLALVMELVVGAPLSALARQARLSGARLPPSVVVAIVSGMLRGLHAAHCAHDEQGNALLLVHRDVSPQNVLVGVDGVARVVDFGIAKAMAKSTTTRGQLKGKPGYMSPEQLRGERLDARTDIYAGAVVLWEALTGQRLFAGGTDQAVARKILEKAVDAPSRLEPALPNALDMLTLRGLARGPADRFDTALAFAEALEQAVRPASASEVAALVRRLCGEELRVLEAAKRRTEPDPSDAAVVAPPASNETAGNTWAYVALVATVLLASVGIGLGFGSDTSPAEAPPSVTQAGAAETEPGPSLPVASAAPPADAAAAAVTSAAAAKTPAVPPARQVSSPAPRVLASAKRDCDPPYIVDADGYHRMKPQCL